MSAIQEALNLREEPPAAARQAEPAPPTAPAADPFANIAAEVAAERPARRRPSRSAPPIDEDLFLQETVGRAEPAAPVRTRTADVEEVRPSQRAANDDRQSVGQILQSMQRRPSRAPYMAAFFLSAVWVVLGIVVGALVFRLRPAGHREPGCASDAVCARGRHRTAGAAVLRARTHDPPCAGTAHHRALDDGSRDAARRAGDHRARVDRVGRAGDPARSRGHGRRRGARAGARGRA